MNGYIKHDNKIKEYNKTVALDDRKCIQCGRVIGAESLLNEVCGTCCRLNHRQITRK